jgi:hypothetical protein
MPRISARTGRGTRVSMSYTGWVICGLLALPLIAVAALVAAAYAVLRAAVWGISWLIARSRRA